MTKLVMMWLFANIALADLEYIYSGEDLYGKYSRTTKQN